jgi:hypothetical protein
MLGYLEYCRSSVPEDDNRKKEPRELASSSNQKGTRKAAAASNKNKQRSNISYFDEHNVRKPKEGQFKMVTRAVFLLLLLCPPLLGL